MYGSVFGNYTKAFEYYERALQLAMQQHHFTVQAIVYQNLTAAYRNIGSYEKAHHSAKQALAIRTKIGNISATAVAYRHFGILHLHQGNTSLARDHLFRGIQIADQYNRNRVVDQVISRSWLAIAYLIENQIDDALQIVAETKPFLKRFTASVQVYSEILLEAIISLRLGQLDKARQLFERTMSDAMQLLESKRWSARYHRAFAQAGTALVAPVERQAEHLNQATELFRDAVEACGWVGILDDALLILREMQKADSCELLKPIEAYLVEKREIAWKNRPFSN